MLDIDKKVDYKTLNNKQKENFNFHHIASALADYGYNSIWLNDDYEGADFVAIKEGSDILKIQLKGRFEIDHKYRGKDIYIAYRENGENKIYEHDAAYEYVSDKVKKTKSWESNNGHSGNGFSWGKTPKYFKPIIHIL